jgi:serine/threonine protein kinase
MCDGIPHVPADETQHRREVNILKTLCMSPWQEESHAHIIHVWFVTQVVPVNPNYGSKWVIIMDRCDGNLYDYINGLKRANLNITENQIIGIAIQILRALIYCHDSKFTHRDLNPRNGTYHQSSWFC